GHVGERERELPRARGQLRGEAIERPNVGQAVEEGIELVGVVVLLAAAGLGIDRRQSSAGVGLCDRQIAKQERITVAEPVGILASVMHADRDLDAHHLVASWWVPNQRRIAPATTASTT